MMQPPFSLAAKVRIIMDSRAQTRAYEPRFFRRPPRYNGDLLVE